MVATIWGTESASDFLVSTESGDEFAPAVADSGGGSFGVAWTSSAGVTVRFYDVVGQVDPALGTLVLTSDPAATNVSLTAGGAVGYAATWETASGALMGSYIDTVTGQVSAPFVIDAPPAGFVQHDAVMGGYAVEGGNGNKPVIDGFNVIWVSTDGTADDGFNAGGVAINSQGLTQDQIDAGYGQIMLQRYAVPLDDKVDPTGDPVAAGLDGVAVTQDGVTNTDGNLAHAIPGAIGRDPSTIVTHDGETVITWIDTANQVHLQVYDLGGNNLNGGIAIVGGGTLSDIDGIAAATGAGVTPGFEAKVVDLAGAGFVVAWVGQESINVPGLGLIVIPEIRAVVFSPGANPGTYTAGTPTSLEVLPVGFAGDFSLGTLVDSGGFSLSYTVNNPATGSDVFVKTFGSDGTALGDATHLTLAGDQTASALAGLIGDRIIAVYKDDASGNVDVGATILDTRTLADGSAITLNGPGLTLTGDDVDLGRERARADQLVGTIGNDSLIGKLENDELYGALGSDTLEGDEGDDLLFGGGGNDTAVYRGNYSDYTITYLGGLGENALFAIEDTLNLARDGTDTVRGVENFQFADVTVTAASIIGGIEPITPTAWGWTDEDGDKNPNADGTPDVDGFIVNHAAATNGDVDTNAFVADSVGEFIGVVWEHSENGGDSRIQGQFYDVIGAFDEFMPNVVNLSDGIGIETNPVIVSGGANSGWGIAFEERDNSSDDSGTIRTNFQGPGFLTGSESTVLDEGSNVNQHDAAMSGSFLDRTLDSPEGGSVLPTGMNEGYNVVWVSTDLDETTRAATNVAGDGNYGRIMMQRFEVPLDALGNPGAPVGGGVDGIAGLDGHTLLATADGSAAEDQAFWVGDEAATGTGGIIGRNPTTAALHTFETAVIWIEQDGSGGERVAGRIYDDIGQVVQVNGFNDISSGFGVAAGTNAFVVSAGAVNFGIVWVTPNAASPSGLTVMGTMFSSPGTGLDGQGFSFGAPAAPFTLFDLPDGVSASDLELFLTGISGEDSEDLIVSWKSTSGGDSDMMAQHIQVALDPITGIVLAMQAEGDVITVNAETSGNQDGGTIAGMLGDRFIAVYHDDNANYTDGNDIVARIIDTRDAVNPDPIVGDLIRNGDPQARRDVLIGTNGNDFIQGDISDADGLVDYIFAGMGDDVIQGGPGLRGAAGIPEIINGGEGNDTAVYTGRLQDYSISINGDGSIEVIDLRPSQDPTTGDPLQHDGIDNLYEIENIQFLDLANGGAEAQTITFGFPGTLPDPNTFNGVSAGPYDGTPIAWSLDDESTYKETSVDTDPSPGDASDAKSGINVINLQDGAGLAWISGSNQVWAITYDTTGKPDPILLGENTELTDGAYSTNTVANIDVAMTAGLGMTAVWESSDGLSSQIHLRFASTNTHVVLDPGGGVPGPGLPGPEATVAGSGAGGFAVKPVIQGYEIVNVDNDTLEVGFHVGYVLKAGAGDTYGTLQIARYEIPVYDIAVGPDGLPLLDANGQGQLATDAFNNLVPSTVASFGTGSETAPISIGFDGLRGTGDDAQPFTLDDGLGGAVVGRDISMGSLHDGQLVVTYIGTDERVHLNIYVPSVDENGDRELTPGNPDGLGDATDIVATGITTYSELPLPGSMTADLGAVANLGQTAFVVPQQNGSFGVFWAAADGGNVAIQGIIYSGAGTNWSPSEVITFASNLAADVHFQVAPTGVDAGGLEDGFFVSWEDGSGIVGQRFSMTGDPVGATVKIGNSANGVDSGHSSAGIDDGLMLFGYEDGDGNVVAQYLDNREPGIALIGPRTGAPRDVIVGTTGDDAIDGRALSDELYGGLGNDLITMGSGADIGFGGKGDDTIIGATGQDQLYGEEGNDLLWGGLSGPADPKVSREVVDGLILEGRADLTVDAAGNPIDVAADIISGGAGIDTISFQGEFGSFDVNLVTGVVMSDRDRDGTFELEDLIGALVDDGAGATPFQFTHDIENATGGIGDDTLTGDGNSNVLIGGNGDDVINGGGGNDFLQGDSGDDLLDGGAGIDTAVFDKSVTDLNAGMFTLDASGNWVVATGGADGTDTLVSIEIVDGTRFILIGGSSDFQTLAQALASGQLQNGDVLLTFVGLDPIAGDPIINEEVFSNDNPAAPVADDDTATTAEDTPVVIDVRANDFDPDGTQVVIDPASLVATNGTAFVDANGNIVFTPDADFHGTATVDYQVLDTPLTGAPQLSNVATVTIEVTPTPDAPTAVDDEGVAVEAAVAGGEIAVDNVLLNDIDPDLPDDTLTVVSAGSVDPNETGVGQNYVQIAGLYGTLEIRANGDFRYTANDANPAVDALTTGETLDDVFTYRVSDELGATSTAILTVTIEGANDAPLLANAIADQDATTAAVFTFAIPNGTFTDVDTDNLTLTATLANGQPLSSIGLSFDSATRAFSGTPTQQGQFDIVVTAFDGESTVDDTFTINVAGNEAPTNVSLSNASFLESAANGFIIGNLSAIDPDGSSSSISFTLTDDAGGRFQVLENNGTYSLAVAENLLIDHRPGPNGDLAHSYTVEVTATDASGGSTVQSILVTAGGVAETRFIGGNGRDTLNGTNGNDFIDGGGDRDTMSGGAGNDVYVVDNSGDKITEGTNAGIDTVYTTLNKYDMGSAKNAENLVYTGTGNFEGKLSNSSGTLVGAAGSDKLQGGSGNDLIEGLGGNDTISGGGGNDTIVGGAGDDLLTGGSGNDTFVFRPGFGNDVVTDFSAGNDIIEISSGLFADFDALSNAGAISVVGLDTLISIGDDSIVLQQVTTPLDATDFRFV